MGGSVPKVAQGTYINLCSEPLGWPLNTFGDHLGHTWDHLGPPWDVVKIVHFLGPPWDHLGPPGTTSETIWGTQMGPFGTHMGYKLNCALFEYMVWWVPMGPLGARKGPLSPAPPPVPRWVCPTPASQSSHYSSSGHAEMMFIHHCSMLASLLN